MPDHDFSRRNCDTVVSQLSSRMGTSSQPACPQCGIPTRRGALASLGVLGWQAGWRDRLRAL